jgi:hypothetical protein
LSSIRRELEGKKSPSDIVIAEMLSEKYGWTPNEIKNQSLNDIRDYLEIINIKMKLEKKKMQRAKHKR